MTKSKITATLATMACLAIAAVAPASALAEFGFTDINSPGKPSAPAFPGVKAAWAGTCDLNSPSTANGGIGTAPTVRTHCIDLGGPSGAFGNSPPNENFWGSIPPPSWRLDPAAQAGSHPDATAAFFFNVNPRGGITGIEDHVRDITVRLPPGVVGSPTAVPQCPAVDAQSVPPLCDARSQVGATTLELQIAAINEVTHPVYVIEPRDTVTAEFIIAGIIGQFNVPITARGRTNGDYGVDTLALLIPTYGPLWGQAFTFWGVPWASSHDPFRVNGVQMSGAAMPIGGVLPAEQHSYESDWGPIEPFFTNPTRCQPSPLAVGFDVDSWENPGPLLPDGSPDVSDPRWKVANVEQELLTGCDKLDFDPSVTLHPTVAVADSPSGLDVKLATPQNTEAPEAVAHNPADDTGAPAYWKTDAGLGSAHLRNTVIHLPAGTSFNPSAANGLEGCTTKQVGLTSASPQVVFNNDTVTCPDNSQIGELTIHTPLLPDPLEGRVYAAPQNDNPFPGSLTAIYLVAQDEERGISVKLAGKVDLDPATGQISTTFVDNPQLPFDDFELHFKSGPRAPLNTPATCGQFENAADLIPWSFPDSGPQPAIHDPFSIAAMPNGLGCVTQPEDRTFKPGFNAGAVSTKAGAYTNFVLNVTRRDGEQEISGVSLDMAPGLTANLSQTPYCPEASIAAARTKTGLQETNSPSCPPASYIGRADTLAGAGPQPLPTAGRLYLSGPYDADGAGPKPLSPLSVTTIVPAIAGGVPGNPAFDLGNVVIRTGINLDPQTAQVHIDSTDVPYIVGGVPLRIRSVAVTLDKPGFMLNPTNCAPMSVGGGVGGSADPLDKGDDVLAAVSSPFQVGGCQELPFKPKLSLKIKGASKRNAYQQLTASLTMRPGDANLKSISVALPHSEFLAQNHINTVCTRVQYAAKACPEGSIYGFAKATTPLLAAPLEGPVYLRSSSNLLPDMVLALRGQIDLDVAGRVDSVNGGLRNSFEVTPDAPVSSFELSLKGGQKSLLVNSQNICFTTKTVRRKVDGKVVKTKKKVPATQKATVNYTAQNGIVLTQKVPLQSSACAKQQKAAKSKSKRQAKG